MNLLPSDPTELRGSFSELWRGKMRIHHLHDKCFWEAGASAMICSVSHKPTRSWLAWIMPKQNYLTHKILPSYAVPSLFLFIFKCFWISQMCCMYEMAFSISLWYQGFTQTRRIKQQLAVIEWEGLGNFILSSSFQTCKFCMCDAMLSGNYIEERV